MAHSYPSPPQGNYGFDAGYGSNGPSEGFVLDSNPILSSIEAPFSPASFAATNASTAAVALEGSSNFIPLELEMLEPSFAPVGLGPTPLECRRTYIRAKRASGALDNVTETWSSTIFSPTTAERKPQKRKYDIIGKISRRSGRDRACGSEDRKQRKPRGYWAGIPFWGQLKLKRIDATDGEVEEVRQHLSLQRSELSHGAPYEIEHQSKMFNLTNYCEDYENRQDSSRLLVVGLQDTGQQSTSPQFIGLPDKELSLIEHSDTLLQLGELPETEYWDDQVNRLRGTDPLQDIFGALPLDFESHTDAMSPLRGHLNEGFDCQPLQPLCGQPCHLTAPDMTDNLLLNQSLASMGYSPAEVDLQLPVSTDSPTFETGLPTLLPASNTGFTCPTTDLLSESPPCLDDSISVPCMCCSDAAVYGNSRSSRGRAVLLPSCSHSVCQPCITERYGVKNGYDFCMTCPVCDSFVGRLDVADTLKQVLPLIVHDLLAKARESVRDCFATRPILVESQEAAIVLGCVYHIVAQELGTELALGTTDLPTRPLFWSLDRYFKGQCAHEVTTSERLETALLNCIEITAIDELQRFHGYTWVKRQIGYRRKRGNHRYGWLEMTAALEKNDNYGTKLGPVMRTWASIISWVVAVLTLRWEQRLGFLMGSHNL